MCKKKNPLIKVQSVSIILLSALFCIIQAVSSADYNQIFWCFLQQHDGCKPSKSWPWIDHHQPVLFSTLLIKGKWTLIIPQWKVEKTKTTTTTTTSHLSQKFWCKIRQCLSILNKVSHFKSWLYELSLFQLLLKFSQSYFCYNGYIGQHLAAEAFIPELTRELKIHLCKIWY